MPPPSAPIEPTPPGSDWTRTYVGAAALAVLVMLLLWWLTAALNTPLGNAR